MCCIRYLELHVDKIEIVIQIILYYKYNISSAIKLYFRMKKKIYKAQRLERVETLKN